MTLGLFFGPCQLVWAECIHFFEHIYGYRRFFLLMMICSCLLKVRRAVGGFVTSSYLFFYQSGADHEEDTLQRTQQRVIRCTMNPVGSPSSPSLFQHGEDLAMTSPSCCSSCIPPCLSCCATENNATTEGDAQLCWSMRHKGLFRRGVNSKAHCVGNWGQCFTIVYYLKVPHAKQCSTKIKLPSCFWSAEVVAMSE